MTVVVVFLVENSMTGCLTSVTVILVVVEVTLVAPSCTIVGLITSIVSLVLITCLDTVSFTTPVYLLGYITSIFLVSVISTLVRFLTIVGCKISITVWVVIVSFLLSTVMGCILISCVDMTKESFLNVIEGLVTLVMVVVVVVVEVVWFMIGLIIS